jgi:hypothetical protein
VLITKLPWPVLDPMVLAVPVSVMVLILGTYITQNKKAVE